MKEEEGCWVKIEFPLLPWIWGFHASGGKSIQFALKDAHRKWILCFLVIAFKTFKNVETKCLKPGKWYFLHGNHLESVLNVVIYI